MCVDLPAIFKIGPCAFVLEIKANQEDPSSPIFTLLELDLTEGSI